MTNYDTLLMTGSADYSKRRVTLNSAYENSQERISSSLHSIVYIFPLRNSDRKKNLFSSPIHPCILSITNSPFLD